MANNKQCSYFTNKQIQDNCRKANISVEKNTWIRQQSISFAQEVGNRLNMNQLVINTATVYIHRFHTIQCMNRDNREIYEIAMAALLLASKVENQSRYLVEVGLICLQGRKLLKVNCKDTVKRIDQYESIILATLGFDLIIDHPHPIIIKLCQKINENKNFIRMAYTMATTTMQLTTMCLSYKPEVVACICIHLSSEWTKWQPPLVEGKPWFKSIDQSITLDLLETLCCEYKSFIQNNSALFNETLSKITTKKFYAITQHMKRKGEELLSESKRLKHG